MRCRIQDVVIALAIAGAAVSLACSKTSTSLTGPTADKCQVSVSSTPSSFAASGGQGSVTIVTSRDCTWSIKSDANWVSIGSEAGGQGEASIPYTVAPNPVPSSRTGAIVVGSQSVAVSQAAAACAFSLSRPGEGIAAGGGRLAVDVTTITGCSWNATSGASWIVVSSGQSGNGTGTVGLAVAVNAGGSRVGEVNIAGLSYTVTQASAPPPEPTPAPPPAPTPGPAPGPTPGPTPGPKKVEFDGTVFGLLGRCPNVVFFVRGMTIIADRSTNIKGGNCDDLRGGTNVSGAGTTESNGTIRASEIRIRKDHDND